MTTLEEQLTKRNLLLKEGIETCQYKIKDLKGDVKDLQDEIKIMVSQRACPALIEARETIKALRKQLKNHEEYERNTLIKGSDNARN